MHDTSTSCTFDVSSSPKSNCTQTSKRLLVEKCSALADDVISNLVCDAYFPKMIPVLQKFPRPVVKNIPERIRALLLQDHIASTIQPGMEIAITCGSRGVANIHHIIKEICACVYAAGAKPFIVPAMGSHGGASAEGQLKILEGYGVTEAYCNAPIRSCMDVVRIGTTDDGRDVMLDSHAAGASGIIAVGRVKPHTDFHGQYESGLLKMLVVGLGKQRGAEAFHAGGPQHMAENLQCFGAVILQHAPILFGIAILENAYDETARIEAITRQDILHEEPPLLLAARELMAKSYIQDLDLLIVDRIGKDISGDGMDPNITGRYSNPWMSGGINATKIAILDISDESNGQMVGLGYGDVTTMRCLQKCDLAATYPNALTSTTFSPFRIPMVMQTDKEAIGACLKYCGGSDVSHPRVLRMRDTLHMGEIQVSESLLSEVNEHPCMEVIGEPRDFPFDSAGNLL